MAHLHDKDNRPVSLMCKHVLLFVGVLCVVTTLNLHSSEQPYCYFSHFNFIMDFQRGLPCVTNVIGITKSVTTLDKSPMLCYSYY